jgi:hypothetical protein
VLVVRRRASATSSFFIIPLLSCRYLGRRGAHIRWTGQAILLPAADAGVNQRECGKVGSA